MFPKRVHTAFFHQGGFALVTAIFLLVVLAGLGGFIVNIFSSQQQTSALDIQGARAYQAARAGLEWATFQLTDPENQNYGLTSNFTKQYVCPATPTTLTGLGGSLSSFTVTVNCTSSDHSDGGNFVRVYYLTSLASSGGAVSSPDYVERLISLTTNTCRQTLNGQEC